MSYNPVLKKKLGDCTFLRRIILAHLGKLELILGNNIRIVRFKRLILF